jgi:hypothetical protein
LFKYLFNKLFKVLIIKINKPKLIIFFIKVSESIINFDSISLFVILTLNTIISFLYMKKRIKSL